MSVDFSEEIMNFREADFGEEVRGSLISIAEAVEAAINAQLLTVDPNLEESGAGADAARVGILLYGSADHTNRVPNVLRKYTGAVASAMDLPINCWCYISLDSLSESAFRAKLLQIVGCTSDVETAETRFPFDTRYYPYLLTRLHRLDTDVDQWILEAWDGKDRFVGHTSTINTSYPSWVDASAGMAIDDLKALYAGRDENKNALVPYSVFTIPSGFELKDQPKNSCFSLIGSSLKAYLPETFEWADEIEDAITYHVECKAFASNVDYGKEWHIHAINSGITYYGWNTYTHAEPYWKRFISQNNMIKVLFVGNSYTEDAVVYAPFLIKKLTGNVSFTMGISYISGGRTDDYQDNFDGGDEKVPRFYRYVAGATSWTDEGLMSFKEILDADAWDMIFFNGFSADDEHFTKLNALIDDVAAYKGQSQSKPIRYGLLDVQRRLDTTQSFADLKELEQRILDATPLNVYIPCGTAVEIARTTSLDSIGTVGHLAEDENGHMQEGLPRLLTAYVTALSLLTLAGLPWFGIIGDKFRPSATFPTTINVPGRQGNVTGVSDANCLIAQKCAVAAIKKPFELSIIT